MWVGTYVFDGKVKGVDLGVGPGEDLGLKGRLGIDTKAIDDGGLVRALLVPGHAAHPFAAVTQAAEPLDVPGARPDGWEEIPDGEGEFAKLVERLCGKAGNINVSV